MKPTSEAELAEAIANATTPLSICGGGSHPGHVPGELLETGGLRGITLYEPGSMTLIAQAGTPLSEIRTALASEHQELAFEPENWPCLAGKESTIGGVVAGNISGPRRIQAGACRDVLLGLRFVDGMGQVLKNGGRVMKNVTGYDLVRLLAGSWGQLGVVTEIALKTKPIAEAVATIEIIGLTDQEAVAVMARALGSPFDITGAAHIPCDLDGVARTYLRIEGFENSVQYRAGALWKLFSTFDVKTFFSADESRQKWSLIGRAACVAGGEGGLWRISCKPSIAPGLVQRLKPDAVQYDWGGGLIWAVLAKDVDVRARLGKYGGHATLVRGAVFSMLDPVPPEIAKLTEGLKRKFDPRGILNTGGA